MLRILLLACALLLTLSALARAGDDAPSAAADQPEDVIVVRGERAGPQLWRVHHPDHTGEVYVFITVPWLPASLEWNERPVASVLEEARLVLTDFEVSAGAVSTTRMAAMMLRTITFNRNRIMMPRGVTLADRVGGELAGEFLHASAVAEERNQRRRQMRRDARRGGEAEPAHSLLEEPSEDAVSRRLAALDESRMHPFFQAMTLIGKAAESADLEGASAIENRVTRLARRHRVTVRSVQRYDLAVSDISHLLRSVQDFSTETNQTCIREAVLFAASDLPTAWLSAQAWARGDVGTLRAHSTRRAGLDCQRAMEAELGGMRTLGGQTTGEIDYAGIWSEAIATAIREGGITLAVVGASGWLREDGVQAHLAGSGFAIDGP